MVQVSDATASVPELRLNVADRLTEVAARMPDAIAVACPQQASPNYLSECRGDSGARYSTTTFAELDADATRIARGLIAWGIPPGTRLALLVRPGIEFVTLVFALLRAGMVIVLVDPGLGRRNLIRCLSEAGPEGFVAIGIAQVARLWWRSKFSRARWNVTVGRRWGWGGITLEKVRELGAAGFVCTSAEDARAEPVAHNPKTQADDPAAIIFTSGSTGAPKGVLYTHRMFDTQVAEIESAYGIESGGVDLGCFPLFALFNSAMGVTTVLPEMDFSRPASADPRKLLAAANDWRVTQAFASPAVWRVVSEHCARSGARIPTLRQVFSCGAPVPADVLRATLACVADGASMHTPYGATECLPVATIEAAEVLNETAARTDGGAGVCVGRKFDSIEWRVIRITDEPIATIDDPQELPTGEIGELIVRGPQVSPRYVTRTEFNAQAKICDERARASSLPCEDATLGGEDVPARCKSELAMACWHRMGDVGYLDEERRFWYCGRKSHRVETEAGTLFTECVEALFNHHPDVKRSALVGVGPRDNQTPVIAIEFQPHFWITDSLDWEGFTVFETIAKAIVPANVPVNFMNVKEMPVDIRHNAKINREQLAARATREFGQPPLQSSAPDK